MQRLLTIQDISCVGQCSLTVALPVISACGIETAVLPSSVLSNHTAFKSWSFNDLTDGMEDILTEWKKQNIDFSAFYTGYVSSRQIPIIKKIIAQCGKKDALVIVDPVMADNGKMYAGFESDFPKKMAELCKGADVILPNITEACFLVGEKYPENEYDKDFIEKLCKKLLKLGTKAVCLTGVSFNQNELGCCIYNGEIFEYYFGQKINVSMHGTGDAFASCFAGALCRGKTMYQAAKIAANFVIDAIFKTIDDKSHWYGVNFEKALPNLIKELEK